MGLFIPNKRAKHRRFDYEPRFYDPKRDQDIKHRMRVMSKARRRRGPARAVYIALLLILAIYLYSRLG